MKYLMLLPAIMLFMHITAAAEELRAFKIYNNEGDEVSFGELAEAAGQSDIIFFGELHNNAIAHWLQLQMTMKLYNQYKERLILGAEMFESDDQVKIDEYFKDLINQASFEKEARIWPNYKTDYKPLIEFAKMKELRFIATNVPRRYASLVSKRGLKFLEDLSPEAKEFLPPLPIEMDLELPGYKKMEEMFGGHGMSRKPATQEKVQENKNNDDEAPEEKNETAPKMHFKPDPKKLISLEIKAEQKAPEMKMPSAEEKVKNEMIENLKAAQAVKDATMAWFIIKNFKDGDKFLHFNGAYHSNDYEGICWFIKRDRPELKMTTITTESVRDINELTDEQKKSADFIILVPEDMTTTH